MRRASLRGVRTTLGYLQLGWLAACVGLWLLRALTEQSEAECLADDGFFCFTRKEALVVHGVMAFLLWVIGAVVTCFLYAMVVWMQRRAPNARRRAS